MRPTIDEQLSGADRLLALAETETELAAAGELITNARRLLKRVRTSWEPTLPFLLEDNARLSELLGDDSEPASPASGLQVIADRNESLRENLSRLISTLGEDPSEVRRRTEIGSYSQWRAATDPT
ncbi:MULTISPECIES: hypothetical protein [Citricoccus]|uniref:Uncharacterized protein n=1 Tax=Citricoccus parietis TaxID=592307 RepID=A0ABV6F0K8_9MICC|nr:hypothetical protein [Citricoccus sp. K5]VXC22094.1 DNA recombination protein RmuC [Citricoccus sp. K5]